MSEAFIGEIRMWAGNFTPSGWALCNGQTLPISENEALYSLIGTTYGGDGVTTFAVPDFQGRVVVHNGTNPTTGSQFPLGQKAGTEQVTLIINQLPQHTHTVNATSAAADHDVPINATWAVNSAINPYSSNNPNVGMNSGALDQVGGNQPHNNMMPSLVISYIISLYGVYPSQN